MNQNQFQFRRFWRLLRVKIEESFPSVVWYAVALGLIQFVYRTGHMLFSLDNIPNVFISDAKFLFQTPLILVFGSYFFSVGILIGFIGNFFSLPVSNLERYMVMHTLPLINLLILMVVTFVIGEGLWRLGLWLAFPSIYEQYVEAIAWWFLYEVIVSQIIGKTLLVFPLVFYFLFLIFSDFSKKYSTKIRIFLLWVGIPLGYIFFSIAGVILWKFLGFPQSYLLILGISLLISIYLLIAAYRGFCNYEPNLEKTTTE